jgi:hypothetical protein
MQAFVDVSPPKCRTKSVANKCFAGVAKFRYLRTTKTNRNFIHGEIKSTLIRECLLPCSFE